MARDNKKLNTILIILIIMTVLFIIAVTSMFVPIFRDIYSVFIPGAILAVLGIPLLILGIKSDTIKLTRIFIILAAVSSISIALGVIFHNLLTAAIIHFWQKDFEEPVFFIISTLVAPAGFLTGAIGTFIMYPRER